MNAGKQFTVGGKVTGETTVSIDGTITLGQTYITAAADSVGDFVLDSDTFFLKRLQEGGKTIWKTAEGVKLTATAGEHGAVSPSGTFTVEKGAEQTFTITPDSGYKIAKVTLEGVDVTDQVSGGRYVLTADQAKALNVTFAKNTQYVTIAATAGSNGSIAPSGMIQVEQDTEKTFTFLPDSGFKVASVTLDGKDVTASVTNNTYTINADTDHTIAVSFEPVVHSVTVTAQAGEHGTVEPAGDIEVEQGTPQSFTFKPDPGYKVETAWVENDDVTKYLQNNIYTFSPDTDCHLMVTFEKMKAPDLEDKIENLPLLPEDAVPDEVQQESILDTKLDYEAMEEGDKAGIEDETVEKLNDALAKLPEINVKQNIQAAANLPDANMVLQNMVFEEAQAIKQGDISEYNIILEVKPADTLTEFQQTEILKKAESAGVTVGRVHDVTVKKEIIRKNTGDKTVEPLTSLRRQITLVFNVSDLPAPTGVERRWSVLAVHGATGALTTELLYDLDSDPNTVTVQSDKFSLYSLVYQDIEPSHSSGTTYYTITASAGTGGSISPKGSLRVARGGSRTFTITPDTGYEVADVKVDGASVGAVDSYTFDRVTKGHTIVAAFRQAEHDKLPFTDVGDSDWFHDSVQYMYGRGLMGGTSDTEFSPQADTTRGMIATILWRLTGKPSVKDVSFTDIPSFAYYADAVAWAAKYGVVKGYDENTFAPDDFITREQLAAMLYRYAGSPTVEQRDMLLAQYHDSGNISRYAVSAVAWTIEQGIITGKGDGILDPKGHATRAETAVILTRYIQKREKIV